MKPFKVSFLTDGCGIYYDKNEPIHLDSLIAWCLSSDGDLQRSDVPDEIELPLDSVIIDGQKVWKASALFSPDETTEALRYWRKRYRQEFLGHTKGSVNLRMGPYREYNVAMPLVLIRELVGYGVGDIDAVRELLKKVKHLGKKRAQGLGVVSGISVTEIEDDFSLTKDGVAMRWLPSENGIRKVRPRPPYWNKYGAVSCCEVGDEYER